MKKIYLRAIDMERLGIELIFVNTEDNKILQECQNNANILNETFNNTKQTNTEEGEQTVPKMIFWDVYLNGKCIDSVPYTADCDKEYVRTSLIHHDGYHPNIVVKKG